MSYYGMPDLTYAFLNDAYTESTIDMLAWCLRPSSDPFWCHVQLRMLCR